MRLLESYLGRSRRLKKIVIIGSGGFGREVLDVLNACNQENPAYEVLGFVVDREYGSPGTIINGKPILGDFGWLEENVGDVKVVCGVGTPEQRYRLVSRALELGCNFATLVHPSVIMTEWIEIGTGNVIAAGCILTNQIKIGDHVHLNLGCTVGHDVVIGSFVTASPGVHISGNVNIVDGVSIGTGANIIEEISINEWATVGAGAAVIRDVAANSTVVGTPARVVKTKNSGWYLE